MLQITSIRHAWPEKQGFLIHRPYGYPDYTFLHFFNSIEVTIQDQTVITPPHTCLLYRPGTPQFFRSPHQSLTHDWIHFNGDASALFSRLDLAFDTLLFPIRFDFITELTQEMESEFFSQKSGREELLSIKLDELFIKLSRACAGEYIATVDASTEERFRKLRGEIFSDLAHPWTVSAMASRVGLSQSRFYSVYRSIYGTSPMDDLIHARIDAAKNALSTGNETISAIAESLGYNNITHFMRQFRGITGTSPAKFRKEGQKKA